MRRYRREHGRHEKRIEGLQEITVGVVGWCPEGVGFEGREIFGWRGWSGHCGWLA